MIHSRLTAIFFFFLLTFSVFGQKISKLQEQYNASLMLFKQKEYAQAKASLENLIKEDQNAIFSTYSLFFKGFSEYYLGETEVARATFVTLLENHADWNKLDEVYYQLAVMDFESGNLTAALEDLSQITNSSLELPAELLKRKHLTSLKTEELRALNKQFPDEPVTGKLLLHRLSRKPVEEVNPAFYDKLVAKFDTDNKYARSKLIKSTFKETYNIAVMLPFSLPDSNATYNYIQNQFVFDLYDGMRLGAEWLLKDSIQINLIPFDTERNEKKVAKLLKDPNFKNVDLIIGPLYRSTIEEVSKFSKANRIPMVNPVSNNPQILEKNEFAYLTSSSVSTQAKEAADYAFNTLDNTSAYIVYGRNDREKIMAQDYLVKFQRNGGIVKYFEPFEFSGNGFEILIEDLDTLTRDSAAHVFVAANEEITAINVMSALQNLQLSNTIFAPEEWLGFTRFTFEQLEKFHVHVTYPNYIDYENPEVKEIIDAYLDTTGRAPDLNSFKGFEAVYYFGKMLNRHGTAFYHYIKDTPPEKGRIFIGFDYTSGNDNQFVPIVKFEKGELIIMNSPWLTAETPAEEVTEK